MGTPSQVGCKTRIDLSEGNFVEFELVHSESSPGGIIELKMEGKIAGNDYANTMNLQVEETGSTTIRIVQPEGRYQLRALVFEGPIQVYPEA